MHRQLIPQLVTIKCFLNDGLNIYTRYTLLRAPRRPLSTSASVLIIVHQGCGMCYTNLSWDCMLMVSRWLLVIEWIGKFRVCYQDLVVFMPAHSHILCSDGNNKGDSLRLFSPNRFMVYATYCLWVKTCPPISYTCNDLSIITALLGALAPIWLPLLYAYR